MTTAPLPTRNRVLGYLLMAGGLAMGPVLMVYFELVSMGRGLGFGLLQTIGTLGGLAVMAHGAALAWPAGEPLTLSQLLERVKAAGLAKFALVLTQVVLFALVARAFQLENAAFYRQIIPLTVFGFVVHHSLPREYRLPFFVALSLGGLLLVLGPANAAWVVAVILAFVGLSRLPVAFGIRLVLVLALGAGLAVLRLGEHAPWSVGIWPVLGSILMFRLIVYMYDIKHAPKPPTLNQTLAYFVMIPNVTFPLFPVVDFATFCRTHYDKDPYEIYQQGLEWILRGVTHLLLYRIVYQHFALSPSEVATTGNLLQYLLATFLLYLRVSGQFHLIIGMLHLFGFRLPETHHLFYLSSSFTDFWRRINIYWKDFMMKVVFYPVYFPARKKRGDTTALVLGTAAVFFITWVTHSYQWFWILGSWLISWTDGLFWAILGVFLIFGSLREMKKGRVRAAAVTGWQTAHALRLAGTTILTFTIICLLWSFWGSETIGEWLDLMSVRAPTAGELLAIVGVLAFIGTAAAVLDFLERRRMAAARVKPPAGLRVPLALKTAAGFGVLMLASSPAVSKPFGERAETFQRELRVPELSRRDQAQMQRGYYENLTGVGTQNSQLWELFAQRPAQGFSIWQSGVLQDVPGFLGKDMVPNFSVYWTGLTFTVNRWGMRDRDYAQTPPAGTSRIAILGQSYVAGDGVSDNQTFENIVEDRLNERQGAPRVEILNFAVGSYSVPQQVVMLERALTFQPKVVMLVAHAADPLRGTLHLVQQLHRGVEPPYPYLKDLLQRARVNAQTREAEALSRLMLYRDSIQDWSFREIVRQATQAGAIPVFFYLSTPERNATPAEITHTLDLARGAGFAAVVDMSGVYDGHDLASLQVSPWDFHPNAAGHRVIADGFYAELLRNPVFAPVVSPAP